MTWWTDHVVPRIVDASLGAPAVHELRRRVCDGLNGRVLEVGFGSGLNLPFLPPEVTALDAVEPVEVAWNRSAQRRADARQPVARIGLDGATLSAPDASYDAVLMTFVLCTVDDPDRVLAETARVLVPGGRLHFIEHGRAPEPGVVRWQRRLEPVQRRIAGGCHLTRDVSELADEAGFEVTVIEANYLPAPAIARPWTYGTLGVATLPGDAA